MKSEWNLWVWLVGVVSRRQVWLLVESMVWLECIGVVSGCCCKEVYRFPHNITYPYTPLVLVLFCRCIPTSLFILKMFFRFCLWYFCAM